MRANKSKREEMTEKPVSFTLETSLLAKIDALAAQWDRSRAWVIRKLLGDAVGAQTPASPDHSSPHVNHTAAPAQ